jgi:amidohydrolase
VRETLHDADYVTMRMRKLPLVTEDLSAEIKEVSRFIYAHPELGSMEHQSCSMLVSKLRQHGFDVMQDYLGMKTAFLAKLGDGTPNVAIFAEYDALPLGHACGHNLVAAWAFGVAASLAKTGVPRGSLYVVGSPAEEGHGKHATSKMIIAPHLKELSIEAVFSMHPGGHWGIGGGTLALSRMSYTFHGREAHVASSPEYGLNALDAAVQFYIQVKMLRTQVKRDKDVIIAAVFHKGGSVSNVIPGLAEIWMDVRANDSLYLKELEEEIKRVAFGAAEMTACSVEWTRLGKFLDAGRRHPELEALYYKHASDYLPKVGTPDESWAILPVASDDISNVSQIIPVAEMTAKIGREGLPRHSEEWKRCSGTPEAEEALLTSVAIAYETIKDYLTS